MTAAAPSAEPGQVWWCDGIALSFEPHFKRRPVLVVDLLENDELLVIPLSSRRHFGQEQSVTHTGGVSYFAGPPRSVPRDALRKSLGTWEGFNEWRTPTPPAPSLWSFLLRFARRTPR